MKAHPLKEEVVNYLKSIGFEIVDTPYSHYVDGELIQEDLLFENKGYENNLQTK